MHVYKANKYFHDGYVCISIQYTPKIEYTLGQITGYGMSVYLHNFWKYFTDYHNVFGLYLGLYLVFKVFTVGIYMLSKGIGWVNKA